ncbi:hypothetical protein [Streptomyces sp. Da 82-17]|uniref:hypothetical protein n=1 Tax=Streptomyces sp. Da 82-17 TaxID=3377116 RepID=UPI0038D4CA3B
MEPTILDIELFTGMEIGDDVPDCCGEEMADKLAALAHQGHREYECMDCGTVVDVDDLGLVFDITSQSQATA